MSKCKKNFVKCFILIVFISFFLIIGMNFNSQKNEKFTNDEVYELVNLRDEKIKHFRLSDGEYVAVQYNEPVHKKSQDGSSWIEINNSLKLQNRRYSNSEGDISFSKDIKKDEEVLKIVNGAKEISFNLKVDNYSSALVNSKEESNDDFYLLDNLTTSILYQEIYSNVDLEYIYTDDMVKENIIIKNTLDNYEFVFTLKVKGLNVKLNETGNVIFKSCEDDEILYTIPKSFMYDSNGLYSYEVEYSLITKSKEEYELIVLPNKEWIENEEITFPVYVDPPIRLTASDYFDDTFISSSESTENMNDYGFLCVGNGAISYWKTSTLPNIPNDAYITKATYNAQYMSLTGWWDMYINAYKVMSPWDGDTFTYEQYLNGSGKLYDYAHDSVRVVGNTFKYYWDITDYVISWYNDPDSNYGIALGNANGLTVQNEHVFRFTSGVSGSPLCVYYNKMSGIEEYWSYQTQTIGTSGKGYINRANGQLSYSIGLLTTKDNIFSFTPSLIYNQYLSGKFNVSSSNEVLYTSSAYGKGFKMNLSETIVKKNYYLEDGSLCDVYIWVDSDGTKHYFYPDSAGVYRDEDGLCLTLSINEDDYLITDNKSNVRKFTKFKSSSNAILSEIIDKNNNAIKIILNENGYPSRLLIKPNGKDDISYFEFSYNNSNKLKSIKDLYTNEEIQFLYSSTSTSLSSMEGTGLLRKIIRKNGQTILCETHYEYDTSGKLLSIYDSLTSYKIEYTYLDSKVIEIQESYLYDTVNGHKMTLEYKYNNTEIRTPGEDDISGTDDDILTIYNFDNVGRVTNYYITNVAKNQIYSATSGEYEEQSIVKNNISVATTIGSTASNYIVNGGFENNNAWKKTSNISFDNDENSINGKRKMVANLGPSKTASLYQYVSLKEGTYTISFEIDSQNAENATVDLIIYSLNTLQSIGETIPLNESHISGKPVLISYTFEVENNNDNLGDDFRVFLKFSNNSTESGMVVSIDDVMLEKNIGHTEYSLVEFGNFESYSINPNGSQLYTYANYWGSDCVVEYVDDLFGNSLKFDGQIKSYNKVTQTIYECNSTDKSKYDNGQYDGQPKILLVTGMAKGSYQVSSGEFNIRVDIQYYQGNGLYYTETELLKFNPFNNEWQYLSKTMTTKQDCLVSKISVSCEYINNFGVAYFDNIFVSIQENSSSTRYVYDEFGRISVKINDDYYEFYEYNTEGKLSLYANSNGEMYEYSYTGSNLTSEIFYLFEDIDGGTFYPYGYENKELYIVKYPKTQIIYTYNNFGQQISSDAFEIEYDNDNNIIEKVGSKHYTSYKTYITTDGSRIFGKLLESEDSSGAIVKYYYDEGYGYLLAAIKSDGTGLAYSYDEIGNISKVQPAILENEEVQKVEDDNYVEYEYDEFQQLNEISTSTMQYSFHYNVFGLIDSLSIGDNEVVSYVYDNGDNSVNGKLRELIYSNGYIIKYNYDELSNLSKILYEYNGVETVAYEYSYTASGQLYKFDNYINNKSTIYEYDVYGQLTNYYEVDLLSNTFDFSTSINYDDLGMISKVEYLGDYIVEDGIYGYRLENIYGYNHDQTIDNFVLINNNQILNVDYEYDEYKRLLQKEYEYINGNISFNSSISYYYNVNNSITSGQLFRYISSINEETNRTYEFTYDDYGNIDSIVGTNEEVYYYYDDLGQLIRTDDYYNFKTYIYEYDNSFNLLSKKTYSLTSYGMTPTGEYDEIIYNYGNVNWKDQLTSINGNVISYDSNGNPTNYYNGFAFTWISGNQLSTASINGNIYQYKYDENGIRTNKIVNGVEHKYYLTGSRIISEEWLDNVIIYLYDGDCDVVGMQYRNSTFEADFYETYLFEKNIFGDIITVYNEYGEKLISYRYDEWGNFQTTFYNNGSNTNAIYNNMLYRGYYYDREIGLYYLNSRYYDSNIGRFISPDAYSIISASPMGLTDKNLYSYCDNNPIMRKDEGGMYWDTVFDAISLAFSIVDVVNNPDDPWAWVGLAADVVSLVVPFATGGGAIVDIASKADDVIDLVDNCGDMIKAADNAIEAIDTGLDISRQIDNGLDVAKSIDNGLDSLNKVDDIYEGAIDSYNNLRKTTKGSGLEVHHIMEKRLLKGNNLDIKPGAMDSIVLDKDTHRAFTNAWRKELPYGQNHDPQSIMDAAEKIYKGYPSLIESVRKTLFN